MVVKQDNGLIFEPWYDATGFVGEHLFANALCMFFIRKLIFFWNSKCRYDSFSNEILHSVIKGLTFYIDFFDKQQVKPWIKETSFVKKTFDEDKNFLRLVYKLLLWKCFLMAGLRLLIKKVVYCSFLNLF